MFCERCGRILRDGELTCPECGAYYGPIQEPEKISVWYLIVPMIVAAAATAVAAYFIGFYMLLLFLFFWMGPTPVTKGGMVLRGVSYGLMIGALIGLCLRYLSGIL